jgi:hypothetical protein
MRFSPLACRKSACELKVIRISAYAGAAIDTDQRPGAADCSSLLIWVNAPTGTPAVILLLQAGGFDAKQSSFKGIFRRA